ncbi:MAG: hypothetical protein ACI9YB_003110 [Halioglobus sp.]|jgi:hypothetical protein
MQQFPVLFLDLEKATPPLFSLEKGGVLKLFPQQNFWF